MVVGIILFLRVGGVGVSNEIEELKFKHTYNVIQLLIIFMNSLHQIKYCVPLRGISNDGSLPNSLVEAFLEHCSTLRFFF